MGTLFVLEGLLANADDPLHVAANPFQHTGLAGHTTRYEGAGLAVLEAAHEVRQAQFRG